MISNLLVAAAIVANGLLVAGRYESQTAVEDQTFSSSDLAGLADRYCIGPDGDHVWTWSLAAGEGWTPLQPEEFANLRLPGARQLRGFTKTIGGTEVRLLTAVNRMTGMGAGVTYYHLCWVSADPAVRREVDSAIAELVGVDRFRQDDAFVYAWIPGPDDTRREVSRREWSRYAQALAREDGLRMVLTGATQSRVSVTYMTATQDCADWCY